MAGLNARRKKCTTALAQLKQQCPTPRGFEVKCHVDEVIILGVIGL